MTHGKQSLDRFCSLAEHPDLPPHGRLLGHRCAAQKNFLAYYFDTHKQRRNIALKGLLRNLVATPKDLRHRMCRTKHLSSLHTALVVSRRRVQGRKEVKSKLALRFRTTLDAPYWDGLICKWLTSYLL